MRATGSNSPACTAGSMSSTSSTSLSVIFSGSRSAALALVMQMQVAEIDDQAECLAEDENRVVAMHGVSGQHQTAGDAEIPQGHGNAHLLGFFARPPLDDKAHHKERLAAEADADPEQGLPIHAEHQWYSSPIASRTSRMVSRASSRAFSQPSAMMFLTSVGSSRYIWARSRIGICSLRMPSMTGCLHSMQPMPAVLHPWLAHSLVLSSE